MYNSRNYDTTWLFFHPARSTRTQQQKQRAGNPIGLHIIIAGIQLKITQTLSFTIRGALDFPLVNAPFKCPLTRLKVTFRLTRIKAIKFCSICPVNSFPTPKLLPKSHQSPPHNTNTPQSFGIQFIHYPAVQSHRHRRASLVCTKQTTFHTHLQKESQN